MLRTFNCGIGMIAVVAAGDATAVTAAFTKAGETVVSLGEIVSLPAGSPSVVYSGALDLAE
jgi:phosphoribosylformylglycinamidine cyclo-ligase